MTGERLAHLQAAGGAGPEAKQPAAVRPAPLPPNVTLLDLLGVSYAHVKTSDDGDLYLTRFGQPFWEHLLPENWYAKEWFEANRERLIGTSTVYKVPTRKLHGTQLHPAHIIVRLRPDNSLLRDRNGQVAFALVDYELLERTPEHEQQVRSV